VTPAVALEAVRVTLVAGHASATLATVVGPECVRAATVGRTSEHFREETLVDIWSREGTIADAERARSRADRELGTASLKQELLRKLIF